MAESNRPDNMLELQADNLRRIQASLGDAKTVFSNPTVQREMLAKDHNFGIANLEVKLELKRLLSLELFSDEPTADTVILTAIGRLVEQKDFGLIANIAERTLRLGAGVRFAILASAPEGDGSGKALERSFSELAGHFPGRFYFNSSFDIPLSKLILAGGDFSLIPSRFEPCGLVDYESSLLGTIVIGHRTGGLSKVSDCAYLYDWLDLSDREGEAEAFFSQIQKAVETFHGAPATHRELVLKAMAVDSSWNSSAKQYLEIYRYGLLHRQWLRDRDNLNGSIEEYGQKLLERQPLFSKLFHADSSKPSDQHLMGVLSKLSEE